MCNGADFLQDCLSFLLAHSLATLATLAATHWMVAAGKRIRDKHGAPPDRVSGHRMHPTVASALLVAIHDYVDADAPDVTELQALAAALAAAHCGYEHPVVALATESRVDGPYTVKQILSWRAQMLQQSGDAPAWQHWGQSTSWSAAFRKKVQKLLDNMRRLVPGYQPTRRPRTVAVDGGRQLKVQRVAEQTQRPAAVGALPCALRFEDSPLQIRANRKRIAQWDPPRCHHVARLALEVDETSVWPTHWQQVAQAEHVQSWQLHTVLTRRRPVVFTIGIATQIVREWRARNGYDDDVAPTKAVLRSILPVGRYITPTALACPSGHLWDARSGLPLTIKQYAVVLGKLPWLSALQEAACVVTPAQMRALLGQGDHSATTELCLARCRQRLGESRWAQLKTVGSLCCGIDLMGAVVCRTLGANKRWAVEACPIARKAHSAFWSALGCQVDETILRAEDPALADDRFHVDVELVTPRCAPFSLKNRYYPAGCWAAIAELEAILRGVFIRRPRVVIYENSYGLWRRSGAWRKLVETLLCGDRSYQWESMVVSPELHCGINVRRKRVIYIGLLQDDEEAMDQSELDGDQWVPVTGDSEIESDMEACDDDWEADDAWEDEAWEDEAWEGE